MRILLRKGFTLIEIALAISLLAVIATLTYGSIARAFDAYETVTTIDQRYHVTRLAMNRMARELSMAFLTSVRRDHGVEQMWKTIFKGEASTPYAKLTFTAFAHAIMLQDAKESDQCEISYFGAIDPDDPHKTSLMRREDVNLDTEPEKGGRTYVLAEDIKGFKLRYFDPQDDDWKDTWDTLKVENAGRLPSIVEITMIFEDEHGKDVKLVTKTRINLLKELQPF